MEGCTTHDDGRIQTTSTGHEVTTSSHTRRYMYPWNNPGLYMGSGHEDGDAHGMLLRSDSTIILVTLCTTVDDISGLGISHVIWYYLTTSCEFADDVIATCPKSRVPVHQRWEQPFAENHNRLMALSVDASELIQVDVDFQSDCRATREKVVCVEIVPARTSNVTSTRCNGISICQSSTSFHCSTTNAHSLPAQHVVANLSRMTRDTRNYVRSHDDPDFVAISLLEYGWVTSVYGNMAKSRTTGCSVTGTLHHAGVTPIDWSSMCQPNIETITCESEFVTVPSTYGEDVLVVFACKTYRYIDALFRGMTSILLALSFIHIHVTRCTMRMTYSRFVIARLLLQSLLDSCTPQGNVLSTEVS